jgi:hypothetical protein
VKLVRSPTFTTRRKKPSTQVRLDQMKKATVTTAARSRSIAQLEKLFATLAVRTILKRRKRK